MYWIKPRGLDGREDAGENANQRAETKRNTHREPGDDRVDLAAVGDRVVDAGHGDGLRRVPVRVGERQASRADGALARVARRQADQDAAVEGILGNRIKAGDVVVVRYEGPRGGPGMQEMLYPTSYLKSKGLGKVCALVTDGRFSGGSSGLSIGHLSPEAAEGGLIGLVEEGDLIKIDIPSRSISLAVDDATLAKRREAMLARGADAWKPAKKRSRKVTMALKAYAALTTSAARGAVRVVPE